MQFLDIINSCLRGNANLHFLPFRKGQNLDVASSEEEVLVYIGPELAQVESLDEQSLTCKIPETNPGAGDFSGNDTQQGLPIVSVSDD